MPVIDCITALQVLDSRGNPTLKVCVETVSGAYGEAIVPSGASTGEYEAHELRDKCEQYGGKGVLKAVENVKTVIAEILVGRYLVTEQRKIDRVLIEADGSKSKSNLGANAILGVSLAVAHAAANYYEMPLYKYIGGMSAFLLPTPMMNILNGGVHAKNGLDFQEFMIMPVGAKSFAEAVRMGSEIFHCLKAVLNNKDLSTAVGDEGGFAPEINSADEAFSLITDAVRDAGYVPGKDVMYALDAASSEFFNREDRMYHIENKFLTAEQMIEMYISLCEKYPIISIEDALEENDYENTAVLTQKIGKNVQLVGDDLFVTNTERLKKGIEKGVANSILIKPNQIGTLSETIDAIVTAKRANYTAVMSHRSGESEDTTIADLAVALNMGQIKTGSLSRSERIAKYNRLIEIEASLGESCCYAGMSAFNNLLNNPTKRFKEQ